MPLFAENQTKGLLLLPEQDISDQANAILC